MKTVIIKISPEGQSSIDLINFQGVGCGKVASDFAGQDTIISERKKMEYAVEPAKQQSKVNQ